MEEHGADVPRRYLPSTSDATEFNQSLAGGYIDFLQHKMFQQLKGCINSIKDPERITKIVCDRLGHCFDKGLVVPRHLNQHVFASWLRHELHTMTGKPVNLYAACQNYDAIHVQCLSAWGFTMLDPTFGHHEQFLEIDDSTFLISFDHTFRTRRIVFEYAQPAAMITELPRRDWNPDLDHEYRWHQIHDPEKGCTYACPGHPLCGA